MFYQLQNLLIAQWEIIYRIIQIPMTQTLGGCWRDNLEQNMYIEKKKQSNSPLLQR